AKQSAPHGRFQRNSAPVTADAITNAGNPAPISCSTSEGVSHGVTFPGVTTAIHQVSRGSGSPRKLLFTMPYPIAITNALTAMIHAFRRLFCTLRVMVAPRVPAARSSRSVSGFWNAGAMTASDEKAVLHRYLRSGREALLWKLDGLSEYDVRRPLVPTG